MARKNKWEKFMALPEPAPARVTSATRRSRPAKKVITLRVDADVLVWLRSQGRGYQTKINELLRRRMQREQ